VQAAARARLFGYPGDAKKSAALATQLSGGQDETDLLALALAIAGDSAKAEAMADALGKASPTDTVLNSIYLPAIRAQLALNRHDAQKALEELRARARNESGQTGCSTVSPALYRRMCGHAYLALNRERSGGGISEIIDLPAW